MNPIQQNTHDIIMHIRSYIIDTGKLLSKNMPTTYMEREIAICFKGFREIVFQKLWDMVENCHPDNGLDTRQFEKNVLQIIQQTRYYTNEIDTVYKVLSSNEPSTKLETVLKETFHTFHELHKMKTNELLMNMKERIDKEKVITKTFSKRKRSKKRETLKKKGHTWVKGKGAVKTKEVYSHPKHKYDLRSIHKHHPSK